MPLLWHLVSAEVIVVPTEIPHHIYLGANVHAMGVSSCDRKVTWDQFITVRNLNILVNEILLEDYSSRCLRCPGVIQKWVVM